MYQAYPSIVKRENNVEPDYYVEYLDGDCKCTFIIIIRFFCCSHIQTKVVVRVNEFMTWFHLDDFASGM